MPAPLACLAYWMLAWPWASMLPRSFSRQWTSGTSHSGKVWRTQITGRATKQQFMWC